MTRMLSPSDRGASTSSPDNCALPKLGGNGRQEFLVRQRLRDVTVTPCGADVCPTDSSRKAVRARVEIALLHDRRNKAIQLVAVLGADLFGGDHQNRYALRPWIVMKDRHDIEAVHVGHHQIEHDQL